MNSSGRLRVDGQLARQLEVILPGKVLELKSGRTGKEYVILLRQDFLKMRPIAAPVSVVEASEATRAADETTHEHQWSAPHEHERDDDCCQRGERHCMVPDCNAVKASDD